MPDYTRARPGNIFKVTDKGKDVSYVSGKYAVDYKLQRYNYCVPTAWIRNGYVIEVKEDKKC